MKNDRLFQMLYLLLEKGSMTASELSGKLEISVRTVYRDVETLSMAGVPIYTSQGKGGGISLMSGYTFDKTLLTAEEQDQLLFAVQSMQITNQKMDGLLSKLGTTFQKSATDWIVVDFSRWRFQDQDTVLFEQLKTGILQKQILKITYCGVSGKTGSRKIKPLRLIYKDKCWYLQAYCTYADDFRLFKVGRILETVLTGEFFTEDYSQVIPALDQPIYSDSLILVKLRFSKEIAFRVYDEFDKNSITAQEDGSLLTEICFPMDEWVVGYLFSFGTQIEILEPVFLRSRLYEYAQKIAAHYATVDKAD